MAIVSVSREHSSANGYTVKHIIHLSLSFHCFIDFYRVGFFIVTASSILSQLRYLVKADSSFLSLHRVPQTLRAPRKRFVICLQMLFHNHCRLNHTAIPCPSQPPLRCANHRTSSHLRIQLHHRLFPHPPLQLRQAKIHVSILPHQPRQHFRLRPTIHAPVPRTSLTSSTSSSATRMPPLSPSSGAQSVSLQRSKSLSVFLGSASLVPDLSAWCVPVDLSLVLWRWMELGRGWVGEVKGLGGWCGGG